MPLITSIGIRKLGFKEDSFYAVLSTTDNGYMVLNDSDEEVEVLNEEVVQTNFEDPIIN